MSRVDALIAAVGFDADGHGAADEQIANVIQQLRDRPPSRELSLAITNLEQARLWLAATDFVDS